MPMMRTATPIPELERKRPSLIKASNVVLKNIAGAPTAKTRSLSNGFF
jgi:hypothetical protein